MQVGLSEVGKLLVKKDQLSSVTTEGAEASRRRWLKGAPRWASW